MIDVALKAAREAGKILKEHFYEKQAVTIKEDKSFVTEIDKLSEQKIIETIKESFPSHSIKAEESGFSEKNSEFTWLIDPLDGTTNYATSLPFFSVSIALTKQGKLILGVIYDPIHDEMFSAEADKGSKMNNLQIKASQTSDLTKSMIGYSRSGKAKERFVDIFSKVERAARTPKILGSTALHLCYVAAGRLDADISISQAPWDLAAGALIIKEAGGTVTDLVGKEWDIASGDVLASNGFIHDQILKLINK